MPFPTRRGDLSAARMKCERTEIWLSPQKLPQLLLFTSPLTDSAITREPGYMCVCVEHQMTVKVPSANLLKVVIVK